MLYVGGGGRDGNRPATWKTRCQQSPEEGIFVVRAGREKKVHGGRWERARSNIAPYTRRKFVPICANS
jgi:hypothetical protein